jgi:hypothetical protein
MTNPEAQGTLLPQTRKYLFQWADTKYYPELVRLIQAERDQARREALEEGSEDLNAMAEEVLGLTRDQRVAIKGAAFRLLTRAASRVSSPVSPQPNEQEKV